jgi:hypothetical protein
VSKEIKYYGQLRPTGVDNSAARRFEALAGLADQVRSTAFQIGSKRAQEIGEAEGLTAGQTAAETGAGPERRKGFLSTLSIQDQAYNNAMENAFLASTQVDVQNDIARIAAENPTDAASFSFLSEQAVSPVLSSITDEATRARAAQTIDTIRSGALRNIQAAETARDKTLADERFENVISVSGDALVTAAKAGDLLGVTTQQQTIIDGLAGRLQLGTISKVQYDEGVRGIGILAQNSAYQGELRSLMTEGDWSGALRSIETLASKPLKGYRNEEQSQLITLLRSDVSERLALDNQADAEDSANLALRQEANSSDLFLGILNGTAGTAEVQKLAANRGISFSQARTLQNIVTTRGQGIDDIQLIMEIQDNLATNPQKARELITANAGGRLTTSTAQQFYGTATANLTGESPLSSGEAQRFRDYLKRMTVVTGAFAAIDPEAQSMWANLDIVYSQRVLAGERPSDVAAELVEAKNLSGTSQDIATQIDTLKQNYKERKSTQNPMSIDEYTAKYNELQAEQERLSAYNDFKSDLSQILKR